MGACGSKQDKTKASKRSPSISEGLRSELTDQVIRQIQKLGSSRKSSIKTFDAIAMKLGQIEKGFNCIRKIFEKMDVDKSGRISLQEFKDVVKSLSLDDTIVMEIFEEGIISKDSESNLDFKSFILAFASLYLLLIDKDNELDTLTDDNADIKKCFDCVVDAFLFLDTDNDGYVAESEIVEHFAEGVKGVGSSGNNIVEARFKEMCALSGGDFVSFKDFLFAVESWVGLV